VYFLPQYEFVEVIFYRITNLSEHHGIKQSQAFHLIQDKLQIQIVWLLMSIRYDAAYKVSLCSSKYLLAFN